MAGRIFHFCDSSLPTWQSCVPSESHVAWGRCLGPEAPLRRAGPRAARHGGELAAAGAGGAAVLARELAAVGDVHTLDQLVHGELFLLQQYALARAPKSGPLWSMVGWSMALRTLSGTLLGPGICKKCLPLLKVI